jgi:hypothetical protein
MVTICSYNQHIFLNLWQFAFRIRIFLAVKYSILFYAIQVKQCLDLNQVIACRIQILALTNTKHKNITTNSGYYIFDTL